MRKWILAVKLGDTTFFDDGNLHLVSAWHWARTFESRSDALTALEEMKTKELHPDAADIVKEMVPMKQPRDLSRSSETQIETT